MEKEENRMGKQITVKKEEHGKQLGSAHVEL
jgi:hypothetical protein